ncbi:hypothetical protein LK996_14500 [Lysobacter sp. A6]|uniref:Uncharacterized protein n=1 Tax=Noviluteimonas lactosilytica TaxID=2888523 RepID=A0ABS8JKZ1_9GAMM|nr:hypothetical protein [Lysobacter lactosilyticus]MCC8364283.1 hypothetical protein [Lysobacter lactosilyticus]
MQIDRKLTLSILALVALGIAVHGWILSQRKSAADVRDSPAESAATEPAKDTSAK